MAFSRTIGNLRAKVNLFNDWSADLGEDNAPSHLFVFRLRQDKQNFGLQNYILQHKKVE